MGARRALRRDGPLHGADRARPRRLLWGGLPKTRSGKIMRHLLRDIADGRELGDVTTLRDPDVMEQLRHSIRARADEDE